MKKAKDSKKESKKAMLTEAEFVTRGIPALANDGYNSVHVVISGLSEAFVEYFGYRPFEKNADGTVKRDVYRDLVDKGVISMYMAKKGPVIWLPNTETKAKTGDKRAAKNLKKILS